ncbi:MAG: DUF5119 domain-containing protein [Prevotella sp.]|nr:DUF5119 domain-containing protein [Prevotella sp.]
MKQACIFFVSVLLLLAITSCKHKDLDFGSMVQMIINYDWSACPDASPQSMRLMAFAQGTQPEPYPSEGASGVTIALPINTYDFIAYNSDTEFLIASGLTWSGYEISCMQTMLEKMAKMFVNTRAIPMARGTENEDVIYEPDQLWCSAAGGITPNTNSRNTYTLPMKEATHTYVFEIDNVTNLDQVVDMVITVSGISASLYPASGECSDTHCVIPVKAYKSGSSSIKATLRAFGHCPDPEQQHAHKLTLYMELDNGTKWYYTSDITDGMHDEDHIDGGTGNTDIPIVLPELPIPERFNTGGMQPSVEEWHEIEIKVPL